MKIDPIEKIALALHHGQRGAYALLLGSGVSQAAGIPTGWGVTLDLVLRLSALQGEEPLPDPANWYAAQYGEDPDYDKLLDQLTSTPAERMALLRAYFEPTDDEAEEGFKRPTKAHRAVARLVRLGYVRMILTTNFDRLTETALREEGIEPDVIASDDALLGAMPYTHSRCVIVKLHGDYLDTRIRNTPDELAHYGDEMNRYLDRVIDDFGLIICGWSGVWDVALRDAMFRSPNRRFSTFWLMRGDVDDRARDLAEHRKAEVIPIEGADEFFTSLQEKLESLEELGQPHPTSVVMAVASVKRYLPDPMKKIRLHDLFQEETEVVAQETLYERHSLNEDVTPESFQSRLRQFESLSERLIAMGAAVGYYDTGENTHLLRRSIERLASPLASQNGRSMWIGLRNYPALLILYSTGLAALSADHFQTLTTVMSKPEVDLYRRGERVAALYCLHHYRVFDNSQKMLPIPKADTLITPVSDYLFIRMREVVKSYLPDDERYEEIFDRFEFLQALVYMDRTGFNNISRGRFWWKYCDWGGADWDDSKLARYMRGELEKGEQSPLVAGGLFTGAADRFREVYENFISSVLRRGQS